MVPPTQTKEQKMKSAQQILQETKNLPPKDGCPIYRFQAVGDAFVADFMGRRRGIKTKQGDAIALDVDICASMGSESVAGPHSIFESGHITQIMDKANL